MKNLLIIVYTGETILQVDILAKTFIAAIIDIIIMVHIIYLFLFIGMVSHLKMMKLYLTNPCLNIV